MNTLVLGGNGFIGSHLVDKLLAEEHKVRVFDKYEEHYRKPIAEVDYYYGDFGNRGLLADALKGVDMVFHLISTTLPESSNEDPVFDVQSNIIETLFLLEQCVNKKIQKIAFISSGGTVYGTPAELPVYEDNPTNPKCSYGISKLVIEKYLALFKLLHGLNYVIVRPSNSYGARQNPSSIQGAIPIFLNKVAKGEPIEIWGDGEVVRDYIFVDDLVEGFYRAATINAKSHIFNLGSGTGHSLNQIVKIIRRITGCEANVEYKTKRAFDIPKIYLDISRALEELSWAPATSLENGMKKTWEFTQNLYRNSS